MNVFPVPGHTVTVSRRNLERADGDWVDPNFFAEDFSVAAATGFQVIDLSFPYYNHAVCEITNSTTTRPDLGGLLGLDRPPEGRTR